jgi:glyoxylase-like metal-dependent hydrolase (beta-lactamase superfamily II)
MKIKNLTEDSKLYTSNVFFVMGEWNTIEDITTLIDVGSDKMIIEKIEKMNTGLGKRKVDQVIITHSHSDHVSIIDDVIKAFHPKVYAFNSYLKGVDQVLNDGDKLRIGELIFEVYHITAHSYDSICLYNEDTGVLFAGDTNFPIEFENSELKKENDGPISRLNRKNVRTVYNGHGPEQFFTTKKFRLLK